MIYESAQRLEACGHCGAEVVSTVSECVVDGARRWDVEGSCRGCGHARHVGGDDISPEVRATILGSRGLSELRIVDQEPALGAIMRVIRSLESLPLNELRTAARDLVADGRSGPLCEVSLLRDALAENGVRSEIGYPTPQRSGRTISLVKRVVRMTPPHRLTDPETQVEIKPNGLAEDEAELLADYLESATALVLAVGVVPDRLTGRILVRPGVMTDGEWVWDLHWSDYVRAYRVAPPREFRDYVRGRNYAPIQLDEQHAHEIARILGVPG